MALQVSPAEREKRLPIAGAAFVLKHGSRREGSLKIWGHRNCETLARVAALGLRRVLLTGGPCDSPSADATRSEEKNILAAAVRLSRRLVVQQRLQAKARAKGRHSGS
jgi:hypothetical protein